MRVLSPKRHSKLRIFETPMPQLLVLYETWSKQGRTEEQKWAVMNFLTGTGININLIIRERARHAQLALIERLRKHGHGGGNWRRLLDEEAKTLGK